MRTSRRRVTAGLAVAVIAGSLVLSGCGRTTDAGPTAATAEVDDSPATGDLTVWAFTNQAAAMEKIAANFQDENPDVSVTVTSVPVDELPRKLETAIASGQVPDIIMPSTGLQTYVASGGIAPVPEGLLDWDEFFPGAVAATTFDDTIYAMPWYVTVSAFYYRTDLAEAAGLSAPETWEDVAEFATAMNDTQGTQIGYYEPPNATGAWQTIVNYLYQSGAEIIVDDEFNFDTPEVVEALEFYQSFFVDGLTDATRVQTAVGEVEAWFADGQVGSYMTGSFSYDVALEALGGDASLLGLAPLPAGPAGSDGYLGGSALAVMEDAKNADAAWKLLRFASTAESQQITFEVGGVLPAGRAAWETGVLADSVEGEAFAAQLENSVPLPAVANWTRVRDVIATYAEQLAREVITPEEAAASIQNEAAAIGTGN